MVRVTDDAKVTGETRYYAGRDEWDCSAFGGGLGVPSAEVRVIGNTEDQVKANFREAWNDRWGTEWSAEEFAFTHNDDDGEEQT